MRNIQSRQIIKEIFMLLIGSFILAAALYHIHFQNHLTEGGFVGIALFIQNFFDISPSISTVLMDIPIILLCAPLKNKIPRMKSNPQMNSQPSFYLKM